MRYTPTMQTGRTLRQASKRLCNAHQSPLGLSMYKYFLLTLCTAAAYGAMQHSYSPSDDCYVLLSEQDAASIRGAGGSCGVNVRWHEDAGCGATTTYHLGGTPVTACTNVSATCSAQDDYTFPSSGPTTPKFNNCYVGCGFSWCSVNCGSYISISDCSGS